MHPGTSERKTRGHLISVSGLQNSEVTYSACIKPASFNYLLSEPQEANSRGFLAEGHLNRVVKEQKESIRQWEWIGPL